MTDAEDGTRAARGSYHHGNLRQALIARALEDATAEPAGDLSLRGLAGKVGVSPTAVYRHFSSLDQLMAAVAAEGFRVFRSAMEEAAAPLEDPHRRLRAMGGAYLRFAAERPGLYSLIFGQNHFHGDRDEELSVAATAAFDQLVTAVRDALPDNRKQEAREIAVILWALVHGLADLSAKRLLRADPECGDATSTAALDRWLDAAGLLTGKL